MDSEGTQTGATGNIRPRRWIRRVMWLLLPIPILAMCALFLRWGYAISDRDMHATLVALHTTALELHLRDFGAEPSRLHLLTAAHFGRLSEPPPGVEVHVISGVLSRVVTSDGPVADSVLWAHVGRLYCSVALVQACELALSGESSERVDYVLRSYDAMYPDMGVTDCIRLLPMLEQRHSQAIVAFEGKIRSQLERSKALAVYYRDVVAAQRDLWEASDAADGSNGPVRSIGEPEPSVCIR